MFTHKALSFLFFSKINVILRIYDSFNFDDNSMIFIYELTFLNR